MANNSIATSGMQQDSITRSQYQTYNPLNEICFYTRSDTKSKALGLDIRGYWVEESIMKLAWERVSMNLPTLDLHDEQTAETLCGSEWWHEQGFGLRIRIGRCIKYLVDHSMLPLREANHRKKGKRKYLHKTPQRFN